MQNPENNKWLDDALTEAISSERKHPDFEKFQQAHKEEIEMLTSRAGQPQPAKRPLYIRNILMKHKLTKLAAAVVIIVTVFAVLPFFNKGGSGVVLANVLERVEQVQAFIYKMQIIVTGAAMQGMPAGKGKQEMNGTITISNNYGMKMQMTMTDANTGQHVMAQQMYVLPEKKVMFMIMPEQKKYMQMEFDDDLLARMKKQNNDPREMIKQIMNCQYTELGESVIDGVEVEGFQTTDPAFAGMGVFADVNVILWVDIEEQLPVRMEMYFKMNEQMEMSGTVYDYQWDVQVEKNEFEPVIPEDFTAFPTNGMKMPSINEEAAIEGLKFFVEITGQYPKKLNLMSLMQEFSAIKNSKNLTEAGLKLNEEMKQITKGEHLKKVMERVRPVQSLGMFYMMLVQDKKEPAYYGDKLTAEDTDKALLRWKVSDNEYRVIFGDLTTENVSAEQLAELENRLEQ